MSWIQIRVTLKAEQAALAERVLTERGAQAVTISDAAEQNLFEPSPGHRPLWDKVTLVGLFSADAATDQILSTIEKALRLEPCAVSYDILEDKDWSREWMSRFQPIQFGKKLWICPSWLTPPDPSAINLMLDPGMAFGTGTHATTKMCLEWLENQTLTHANILDYGCGSGVLAIAGILLGATRAVATDIDPLALNATRENAQINRIRADALEIVAPDKAKSAHADILIANILAGPLLNLAPKFAKLVRLGGRLCISGLLVSQVEEIKNRYQPWFNFTELREQDQWVMLVATRQT